MMAWSALEPAATRARQQSQMASPTPDWDSLFEEHFDACYRLICRNGVLPADAEDLAQKVFVVAHRKLSQGDVVDAAGPWLRRIALNVVREHHRWRRVRRTLGFQLDTAPGVVPEPTRPPDAQVGSQRLQLQIARTLEGMSTKLREVLVMAEFEEMRPQEIADELSIPVNTVRSRHRRALDDFRRRWSLQTEADHER